MRASKLLELAGLLKQYADTAMGTRRVLAVSLSNLINAEALEAEEQNEKGEPCD